MLEIFMEEFGYRHPISWAWVCKEGVFQLNGGGYSPWVGRRQHIHLPQHAHSIIYNCQERTWIVMNNMSSWLNPRNEGFLIRYLANFYLVLTLPISFNCTCNCLPTFNCIQLHPYHIQLLALKSSAFYKWVIGFQFVPFHH